MTVLEKTSRLCFDRWSNHGQTNDRLVLKWAAYTERTKLSVMLRYSKYLLKAQSTEAVGASLDEPPLDRALFAVESLLRTSTFKVVQQCLVILQTIANF